MTVSDLLVNIDVDDLDKGIEFYVRALGLKIGRRFGQGAVELLGASSPIFLLANQPGTSPFAGAARPRDYGRHWTPVHIDLAVEDVEASVARARAAGARLEGGIEKRAWGLLARMSDPFGHGFCFLQFQGKGYDELLAHGGS
jgi:catechol 2,3-dioxygenase-like lactoylglutathione lyase family enzyme